MPDWLRDLLPAIVGTIVTAALAWLGRQRISDWYQRVQVFRSTYRDINKVRGELADCRYFKDQAERNLEMTRIQATNLADAMEALLRQSESIHRVLDQAQISPTVPKTSSGEPDA